MDKAVLAKNWVVSCTVEVPWCLTREPGALAAVLEVDTLEKSVVE